MKVGKFSINDYLNKLYENSESGNLSSANKEGLIIPDENKKSYDWLKKEYNKAQVAVKVEISGSGASFKPGYDLQTNINSTKEFKPGVFGDASSTSENNDGNNTNKVKSEKGSNLDPKKDSKAFMKSESEPPKKQLPKTNDIESNIKKDKEDKKEINKKDETGVKKIDLKTKK